jgi:hypothetical protein
MGANSDGKEICEAQNSHNKSKASNTENLTWQEAR